MTQTVTGKLDKATKGFGITPKPFVGKNETSAGTDAGGSPKQGTITRW